MALQYLRRREQFGSFKNKSGDFSSIYSSIYSSIGPHKNQTYDYGGIFNLEFSHDGSLLIAACERKSVIILDTINQKPIKVLENIHDDCVNCVKFLDDRLFATCSDDSTVALFDSRQLKSRIRTLQGHSSWVKNIEYSKKDCLLVTSGFDGSILTWDLNSSTETNLTYQKVFHTPGLMRCRLSPDATKLVICTTGGYLILIHDLDLTTLARYLSGFRPNLVRLMQVRKQYLPIASKYDHLFSRHQKTNRVELISDFPDGNNAEVISSLQIHPQGWCALSRNNSYDDSSEWTCIHDIQEMESEDDEPLDNIPARIPQPNPEIENQTRRRSSSQPEPPNIRIDPPSDGDNNDAQEDVNSNPSVVSNEDEIHIIPYHTSVLRPPFGDTEILDLWTGNISYNHRNRRQLLDRPSRINSGVLSMNHLKNVRRPNIKQNRERLLYYAEELNVGKGFIKELCFSSDGRMICSPYGNGVRLLSFSKKCEEIPQALSNDKSPQKFFDQVCDPIVKHSDLVVSTNFSPRAPIFVSGCLQGEIFWYCPR